MFDHIMDSGASNAFINAVTAIKMKGLSFKLVCLILFVFFFNSAECLFNFPPIDIRCQNLTNECNLPSSCLSSSKPFCCFDGCRNICSETKECSVQKCTSTTTNAFLRSAYFLCSLLFMAAEIFVIFKILINEIFNATFSKASNNSNLNLFMFVFKNYF
ncbi:hypothetical protein Anas_14261 [Armadillidium nasatum]|uniref:Uncharacterized protein n=1 Tax=Armadillidium nasatum TaxID=96803 RepID=A0A5N5T0N1_9CRUS|nr:hypothetical protein Anas_14261 [Armadillidium nasatum]